MVKGATLMSKWQEALSEASWKQDEKAKALIKAKKINKKASLKLMPCYHDNTFYIVELKEVYYILEQKSNNIINNEQV